MEGVPDLARQLDYELWAATVAARSLADARAPDVARRRFAHLASTHHLWLARIAGAPAALAVWPELDVPAALAAVRDGVARWRELAGDPLSLARRVDYRNSAGKAWSNTAGEILTHVLFHSAYHRGQIASDLRAAGLEPALTDFIQAARSGALDGARRAP
jgi:uncharacterized damage-inducible protein DinB